MPGGHRRYSFIEIIRARSPIIEDRSPEQYELVNPNNRRRRTVIVRETTTRGSTRQRIIERSPSPPLSPRGRRSPRESLRTLPRVINRSPAPYLRHVGVSPFPQQPLRALSPQRTQRPTMSPPTTPAQGTHVPLPPPPKRRDEAVSNGTADAGYHVSRPGQRENRRSLDAYDTVVDGTTPRFIPQEELHRPSRAQDTTLAEMQARLDRLTNRIQTLQISERNAHRHREQNLELRRQIIEREDQLHRLQDRIIRHLQDQENRGVEDQRRQEARRLQEWPGYRHHERPVVHHPAPATVPTNPIFEAQDDLRRQVSDDTSQVRHDANQGRPQRRRSRRILDTDPYRGRPRHP